MGAIKQIVKSVSGVFKSSKPAAKAASTAIKTPSSAVIKTTSKIGGSLSKTVSGGKAVLKESAASVSKGVSPLLVKVGKNIVVVTGILAIPAAAGLYGYDKLKNYTSRDADYYKTKDSNSNYEDETSNLKNRINVLENAKDIGIDSKEGTDAIDYLTGGSTTPESSPAVEADNTMWYIIGGIALIAGSAYIYKIYKKK